MLDNRFNYIGEGQTTNHTPLPGIATRVLTVKALENQSCIGSAETKTI